MVAWIKILAPVVLMSIAETCRKAPVFRRTVFHVRILADLRVFRKVLRAYRRIIKRIIIGERTAIGTWRRKIAEHLLHVTVLVRRLEVGVHGHIVGERTIGTIVSPVASHRKRVAKRPLLVSVRQVDVARYGATSRCFHHTLHIIVHHAGGIAQLLGAALEIDSMLLAYTGAQGLREPIGIYTACYVGSNSVILLVKQGLIVGR